MASDLSSTRGQWEGPFRKFPTNRAVRESALALLLPLAPPPRRAIHNIFYIILLKNFGRAFFEMAPSPIIAHSRIKV